SDRTGSLGFCFWGYVLSLRTKRHTDCRPIKKMRGQVMPEPIVVFAPSSATSAYHIPGFVISESTAALDLRRNHINGSECYFLGTCHYAEKGFNGHCRLVGSPVFSLKGKVMGLIAGTCVKELNLYLGGYEIKVALLTSHMDGMLNAMLPKSDAAKKKIASRKKGGKFP
ncbi:Os03g0846900, partial [Oryza sativa Japonica Group]